MASHESNQKDETCTINNSTEDKGLPLKTTTTTTTTTPASPTMTYSSGSGGISLNDDDDDNDGGSFQRLLSSRMSSFVESIRPHHSLVGILLIVLGCFCFSVMFLFVKLLQGQANSFTIAFYRGLVEIPIALMLCWHVNENPLGPSSSSSLNNNNNNGTVVVVVVRRWLWVRGGMGAAAVLCFFYAIQHLPLPDAVTLQFTTPPFAAAFAVCLVGEAWMVVDMMGAVVCLLGVMLIAHPSWLFGSNANQQQEQQQDSSSTTTTDEGESVVAIGIGLLGAAFAGLAYTSVRKIGHNASANVMVLYYATLSIPVTLIGSKCLLGTWNVWNGGSVFSWMDGILIVFCGIFAYLGQYMTNLGLQRESAATGSLVTCSQIVFTYIFELTFLHEPINLWSVSGTILILTFMTIVGIQKMNNNNANHPNVMPETVVVAGEPEELALMFCAEHHQSSS